MIGSWYYPKLNLPTNNLLYRSAYLSPFHIYTGYNALTALDMQPLPPMSSASTSSMEFSQHIKVVHDKLIV